MKTAAYIRVSTAGQVGPDKYGLDAQRDEIETYAKANGLEIVRWYADEGVSGASMDRPALSEMLKDAKAEAFKCVLVAKLDRLARDLYGQLFVEEYLMGKDAKGKKKRDNPDVILASAAEPHFRQDPTATLLRQLLGAFAEYERELIRMRLVGGRVQKVKQGGFAGGGVPYGFRSVDGELVEHEEEAEVVRLIYELSTKPIIRKKYRSIRQVAEELNEAGYRSPTGRKFSKQFVHKILSRKDLYGGMMIWNGIRADGRHEPILN